MDNDVADRMHELRELQSMTTEQIKSTAETGDAIDRLMALLKCLDEIGRLQSESAQHLKLAKDYADRWSKSESENAQLKTDLALQDQTATLKLSEENAQLKAQLEECRKTRNDCIQILAGHKN